MRYIDPTLKAKLLLAQQTYYQNAEPHMEVIASRPKTPITNKDYWEETIVQEDVTSIRTSVTVRKTGQANADRAYVAYVEDNNNLTVKSASFTYPITNMIWDVDETIEDCLECSLEFDGSFVYAERGRVEYKTDALPWLFYLTTAGALMGGLLGGPYETIVAANVTAIDAVRGVASIYKDVDQGMMIFYVIAGDTFYRSYDGSSWSGQESVSIAPANAVSIRAERTLDWRIVLQITTATGELYEVFSKMEASGWNGMEFISIQSVSVSESIVYEITYSDYKSGDEYITVQAQVDETDCGYIYSPVFMEAYNLGIEDEYYPNEDWGIWISLHLDSRAFNTDGNEEAFVMIDALGIPWYAQEIINEGQELLLRFNNFNNATNPVTLYYVPGTVTGSVASMDADSIEINLINLAPYYVEPINLVSIYNTDETHIYLEFDKDIKSIGGTTGYAVHAMEPNMQPEGTNANVNYVVSAVNATGNPKIIEIVLTDAGRIKNPDGEVILTFTGSLFGDDAAYVMPFEEGFIPVNIDRVFNPHDVERITLAAVIDESNALEVTYNYAQDPGEYISLEPEISASIVYHVDDIPE